MGWAVENRKGLGSINQMVVVVGNIKEKVGVERRCCSERLGGED